MTRTHEFGSWEGSTMASQSGLRWLALAMVVGMMAPMTATAGPYLGEWSWWWQPERTCPRGTYSPLHYFMPTAYQVRAAVRPAYLDQFPPGPADDIAPSFDTECYRCPSIPPTPT